METIKIFDNGECQVILLPKSCRLSGEEIVVRKLGEMVLMCPKDKLWKTFLDGVNGFSDDFMADGREMNVLGTSRPIVNSASESDA